MFPLSKHFPLSPPLSAKPKSKADHVTVRAGKVAAVVATCEAADGKPAATISWEADGLGGNPNTTTVPKPDGTVTVKSEYWLIPTASHNNRDVKCKVTQSTLDNPQVFPMKLSIQCKFKFVNRPTMALQCMSQHGNQCNSIYSVKSMQFIQVTVQRHTMQVIKSTQHCVNQNISH